MTLYQDERKLILKIIDEPLITIAKLAKELGRSRPTIISQLKRLEEKYDVHAIYKLPLIGLKNINYIFECRSKNTLILKEIIGKFPYSQYRAKVVGPIKGLYVQFIVPTSFSLKTFIEFLMKNKLIESYIELNPQSTRIRSNFGLNYYDENKNDFNFDWQRFNEHIATNGSEFPIRTASNTEKPIFDELEPVDMYILSTMSYAARKRGKELLNPFGEMYPSEIPPYIISRRLKFIKNQLISSYKVQLRWELFNIYQASIFVSQGPIETQKINNLAEQIHSNFPFDSLFYISNKNNGFFWFIAAPPSHFPSIASFIWEFTNDSFDYYYLDCQTSSRYIFYGHHNFDFNTRKWKTDESYLMDEIKEVLEKKEE